MNQYAKRSGTVPIQALGTAPRASIVPKSLQRLGREMWKHRWLYLIITPTIIYYIVFRYIPIWNAQIAFKDFRALLGVEGSPWVGFEHFETFSSRSTLSS